MSGATQAGTERNRRARDADRGDGPARRRIRSPRACPRVVSSVVETGSNRQLEEPSCPLILSGIETALAGASSAWGEHLGRSFVRRPSPERSTRHRGWSWPAFSDVEKEKTARSSGPTPRSEARARYRWKAPRVVLSPRLFTKAWRRQPGRCVHRDAPCEGGSKSAAATEVPSARPCEERGANTSTSPSGLGRGGSFVVKRTIPSVATEQDRQQAQEQ